MEGKMDGRKPRGCAGNNFPLKTFNADGRWGGGKKHRGEMKFACRTLRWKEVCLSLFVLSSAGLSSYFAHSPVCNVVW